MDGKAGEGLAPRVKWLEEGFEELGGVVDVAVPLHMVLLNIMENVKQQLDVLEVLLKPPFVPLHHLLLGMIRVEDHGDFVIGVFRSALIGLRLGLHEPRLHVDARHDVGNPLILSKQAKPSVVSG